MFKSVLVANRGEIAARIIRTLRGRGIRAIGIASDADRFTPPMRLADEVVHLPGNTVADTYLNTEAIIAACQATGAEAVHPGYGFLAENAHFAEQLAAAGIVFIGPRPEHIRAFGLKHESRKIAADCDVPLLPGSGLLANIDDALVAAEGLSYPVMLKSTAGGGGIGMQLCRTPEELRDRFESISRVASGNFGDARLFLEQFVGEARHIEVQIFGNGKGDVIALGERDCSLQRRNQKVIEEAPAPNLSAAIRERVHRSAIALGKAVNYESAGTVEFIYDIARDKAYFLEVNTRLQVEHPVTEEVYGVDLVDWMLAQASGEFELPRQDSIRPQGHAIEARLYAEDPSRAFRPQTGTVTALRWPREARIETWIETGTDVTSFYDPMLAKIVVHGENRADALTRLDRSLQEMAVWGVETNCVHLQHIVRTDSVQSGQATTATLSGLAFRSRSIEVLAPGTQSSLQDWPGRLGYWHVGVPPSGPMDERSHRLVNHILGNAEHAAVLECTLTGPTLRFNCDAIIALGGARMEAMVDGKSVPYWQAVTVKAGATLALGRIDGPGMRCYLGLRGGFDAPLYLGARATFSLGGFGGHATGALKAGDILHLGDDAQVPPRSTAPDELPVLASRWDIAVLYGPHGAPDFFTEGDIDTLFSTDYEVSFNSARTGVRLIGPQPQWARTDGGEAGLHPSNIPDNAYAVGAIDFTGDMPIILGPDGPSLGGFVCPAVVARDELWKLGQLRPGDKIRFRDVRAAPLVHAPRAPEGDLLRRLDDGPTEIVYRRAGEENILIEYGPMALDLTSRLRAHLLMQALETARLPGIVDLTPGIRSLQVHFNRAAISSERLLDRLIALERALPDPRSVAIESRIVHLPLSWNDEQTQLAMRKYQELVRPNAPWCPSNIEFIRRINGLCSEDDVRRIVFDARYLVLGLGDVYLGAPVATPLDPRHRLVTTKYNPARTWTPENAVGIGGAYLCVYGMEGPGGYQLVGRTIQMWNKWRVTDCFAEGRPWLLRFFDQIQFFPVSGEELREARAAFPHGCYPLRIEKSRFTLAEHEKFLTANAAEIASFRSNQQRAFEVERQRWREGGLDSFRADDRGGTPPPDDTMIPDGLSAVHAPVTGTVWTINVSEGEHVTAGQTLIVVESMKMEIAIPALTSGIVRAIRCERGRVVLSGHIIALIEESK